MSETNHNGSRPKFERPRLTKVKVNTRDLTLADCATGGFCVKIENVSDSFPWCFQVTGIPS